MLPGINMLMADACCVEILMMTAELICSYSVFYYYYIIILICVIAGPSGREV